MHETLTRLEHSDFPDIERHQATTLQVNLGYLCNQTCVHCHVNAGPNRKELMSDANINTLIQVLENSSFEILDLTGGAPEMHPQFRYLVEQATALGIKVIDRCNLTILTESGYEGLADFLAQHRVEVVASLPCYSIDNVDRQRGKGVFGRSIDGLKQLNALGYAQPDTDLILNLVYNPQGPNLPPSQKTLEEDYKCELQEHFDIRFNQLFTIINMPIKRFGSMLVSKGQFDDYMQLLKDSYIPDNLDQVMCRDLISVDWQGYLYDCDFNQQLGLPMGKSGNIRHIKDLLSDEYTGEAIHTADHCYGCTAGQGSSCGGAF